MKKTILPLLFAGLCLTAAARDYTLASPDGRISTTVGDNLEYAVAFNGTELFTGSAGIAVDGAHRAARPSSAPPDREGNKSPPSGPY